MPDRRVFLAVALPAILAVGAGWCTIDRRLWPAFAAACLVATLILYLRRSDLGRARPGLIVGVAIAARIALAPLPPTLSDDAYRFAWDARVAVEGFNVYAHRPSDAALSSIAYERVESRLNSADYFSVYPPVSQMVFRAGGSLSGFDWPAILYGIKGLFILAEVIGLLLLVRLTTTGKLALYALNPLVIIEMAGQAHTEALLIPSIAATALMVRRVQSPNAPTAAASIGSGLALAAGALVKLYPVFWLPFLAKRAGSWSVLAFAVAVITLSVPFAAPGVVANFAESLILYVRLFEFNAGPYYLVKGVLQFVTGVDWSKQLGPLFQLAFLAGVAAFVAFDRGHLSIPRPIGKVPFERAAFWVTAAFLVTATTVHPWYFVPLLALWAIDGSRSDSWLWLSAWATGTYAFYSHDVYWPVVLLGWLGWFALLIWPTRYDAADELVRLRARHKARRVLPHLSDPLDATVLDLGCGEGYVAAELAERLTGDVRMMDIVDYHRAELLFTLYNGKSIPLDTNAVDTVLMYFVLHHAADAEQLVREGLRVAGRRLVVIESTYQSLAGRRLLEIIDRIANALRSRGAMRDQRLVFRTVASWRRLIQQEGGTILQEETFGSPPHRQVLFVVAPRADRDRS